MTNIHSLLQWAPVNFVLKLSEWVFQLKKSPSEAGLSTIADSHLSKRLRCIVQAATGFQWKTWNEEGKEALPFPWGKRAVRTHSLRRLVPGGWFVPSLRTFGLPPYGWRKGHRGRSQRGKAERLRGCIPHSTSQPKCLSSTCSVKEREL